MEKRFYNYRRNVAELNEEIIFCAADPESSDHYGRIQRVFVATDRTDKDHSEIIKIAASYYGVSDEEAEALINPSFIVSSAGAWDDIEFINHVYSDTKYFDKYDGIETRDGAVFFEITANNLKETNYR